MLFSRWRSLLLCAAVASVSASAAARSDERFSKCTAVGQRVAQCVETEAGGVESCLQTYMTGIQECVLQAQGVLRGCAKQTVKVSQCLGPELDRFRQRALTLVQQQNSTCANEFAANLRTTEGLEAALQSGRVVLSLAVTVRLLEEAANGTVPEALMYGHTLSYGNVDACQAIPGHHYCWVAPSVIPSSRAGFCVPDSCDIHDLPDLVNPILHSRIGEMISRAANVTIPNITLHNLVGHCGNFSYKATAGTWIMVSITILLVLLVAYGTYVDWLRMHKEEKGSDKRAGNGYLPLADGEGKERDSTSFHERVVDEEKGAMDEPLLQKRKPKPQSPLSVQLASCFSLYRNWASLTAPARPGDFNSLDGIRVFSMFWVVMGHLLAFPSMLISFSNTNDILPPNGVMATYAGQAIIAGEFAVDTFFTIGGLVAAYFLIQDLMKRSKPSHSESDQRKPLGWVWVPALYLHRWLRLTPTYFYVLLMYWKVMSVVSSGPFWSFLDTDYQACSEYWWSNLLYINTLVPFDLSKLCYPVSWYMSNDFMFFIALPFLVWAFIKNRIVGYLLPTLLWAASVIYSWALAYSNDMREFDFGGQLGLVATEYQRDYYFRFWTRAPVYLIGLITGYLWYDLKSRHPRTSLSTSNGSQGGAATEDKRVFREFWQVLTGFVLSFFLLGVVVYGATPAFEQPGWPLWLDHLYLALSRSAWAVGLCLLCWLLFEGHGGTVKVLLENRAMAVLSRLTFAAYLIHPAIIYLVFLDTEQPAHYSTIWFSFNLIGMITTVFLFSAVCFLLVEKPTANLERLLFFGTKKSN